MVRRSDIVFSDAKQLLVGCRGQLEKKIQSSTQKYHTPSKLKNEIKKNIVVSKCKNMFLFEKNDRNIQFNSEILKNFIYLRKGRRLFYPRNKKWCPSEAVSSLRFLLQGCVKGKYIENRQGQTYLSFSISSPLQNMTDLCRFHYTLSQNYLQILKPKS